MTFTPDELRRLLLPALAALAMVVAGIAAIWAANTERSSARTALAVAQEERQKNTELNQQLHVLEQTLKG